MAFPLLVKFSTNIAAVRSMPQVSPYNRNTNQVEEGDLITYQHALEQTIIDLSRAASAGPQPAKGGQGKVGWRYRVQLNRNM